MTRQTQVNKRDTENSVKSEEDKRGKGRAKLSGKETAKQISAGRAKTDSRYWEEKVFKPTFSKNGKKIETRAYSARIQYSGRRHTFPLNTSNRSNAGKEAAKIYLHLLSDGWDSALETFAPKYAPKENRIATVGDYISEVEATASVDPQTIKNYAACFRRIVSDIFDINSDYEKTLRKKVGKKIVEITVSKDARYNYRGGERDKWVQKVDSINLLKVTPAKIQKWKLEYVRKQSKDRTKERHAKTTANSIIRKAKSLFSKKTLPFVSNTLNLPSPLPFDGIDFFPRQSMRYHSTIDAEELIRDAAKTLPDNYPESFKVFLLALGAGLRAREIDTLLWKQVDLDAGTISIQTTPYFKPKSEDSAGVVELDSEIASILRGYRAKATGDFVIESDHPPKVNVSYHYLRAKKAFKELKLWLKLKGIDAAKPIHELRKEFGSQMCNAHGIYNASRALRHADVAITAAHYLDKKERVTVGLGQFLDEKIIPIETLKKGEKNGTER